MGTVTVVIGLYVLCTSGTKITEEWKIKFHEDLQSLTEKTYLTSLTYLNRERRSPKETIVECAWNLVPLGHYIEDKGVYTSELEDEMTNEMILAMQEADENEVDEHGKLAKKDENTESAKQAEKEAKKTNQSSMDLSMEKLKNFDYLVSHFYTVDSLSLIHI